MTNWCFPLAIGNQLVTAKTRLPLLTAWPGNPLALTSAVSLDPHGSNVKSILYCVATAATKKDENETML